MPTHPAPAPIVADPTVVRRIVFFHMNALGDLLFSLPAVRAVRERYPAAAVWSVVRPEFGSLLQGSPLVDVVVPRARGLLPKPGLVARLRQARFDLAVAFSRSPASVSLARATGAGVRVGFATASWRGLLTHHVPWTPPASVENNLRLADALGGVSVWHDYGGLLAPTPAGRARAAALLEEHGVTGPYVIAAPEAGATRSVKEWPASHWGRALRRLGDRWPVVLVGVRPDTAPPPAPGCVDLRGRTDLATLAALCDRASLCIGVDCGVLHLAAALGTPVVGVYGPSDWRATGPASGTRQRIVRLETDCSPCLRSRCLWRGVHERQCLTNLGPDAVVSAAHELLGS